MVTMFIRLSARITALAFLVIAHAHAGDEVRISGDSHQTSSSMMLESGAYREPGDAHACNEKPIHSKKVAVLGFALEQPKDAADIRHVSDGLALLLAKRLQGGGELVAHPLPRQTTQATLPRSELHDLWMNRGMQFAILVRMEDMAMQRAGQQSQWQSPFGPSYHNGKRGLAATLYIYDTLTGQVITSIPYQRTISGSEFFSPARNVLSAEFIDSAYGQGIEAMMTAFSEAISASLNCLPFMARVIDTRHGEVVMDAGRLHGLKAGDRLVIHRQRQTLQKHDAPHGEGRLESPVATITLTEVQPDMATGTLDPGSAFDAIRPGDIARADR